jgi:serine/threonine-protein kinase
MNAPPPPDDWSKLVALVDTLLDTPPEQRAAVIEALSGGDPTRRAELERLRAECEEEPGLLGRPAEERFAALFAAHEPLFPPRLAERYRPSHELGRGGMATVYQAHDLKHGRDVAVKLVHPAIAFALGPERFLREIEIVAQLRHPHIVPLFDSGEVDGTLYYVMPYEPGLSLRQRLARGGPIPLDEAVSVLRDVCDALGYAHAQGIIHRDIKPDNVLLSGRHAMVTDFGVAKAAIDPAVSSAVTSAGLTLGTPGYMAPEQVAGDPGIDHRADLYAVGVLAYELLAGRPPFTGETPREVLAAHLTRVPEPITAHRPDLPAPLAALVMKCLEKRPADRFQTAARSSTASTMSPWLGRIRRRRPDRAAVGCPRRWSRPRRSSPSPSSSRRVDGGGRVPTGKNGGRALGSSGSPTFRAPRWMRRSPRTVSSWRSSPTATASSTPTWAKSAADSS